MVPPVLMSAQPRPPPEKPYTPPKEKPAYEREPKLFQDILLNESFEGTWPPAGWTIYQMGDEGPGQWQQCNTIAHNGSCSALHSYGTGGENYNDWLVTPQIDLTNYQDANLTFYYREYWIDYYYYHGVWISTGSPDPADGDYVELQEIQPTVEGEWVSIDLNLTAYAGQEIYIAFVYQGQDADDWYIDDVVVSGEPIQEASWTFMVYLDADNDLEPYGFEDINEMEMAGSTSDVKIIVLLDNNTNPGSWIYEIVYDTDPNYIASPIVNDLGEVNMGDPNTLVNFVEWTMSNYPAEKYALILWDHGSGWSYSQRYKSVCVDNTDGDELTTWEIEQALEQIHNDTGVIIDLFGFDACLMGMIEVDYQIREYTKIVVGSEDVEPGDGWPYDTILQNLTSDPSMSADQLGTVIVEKYYECYNEYTMAAVNNTMISELASAVSDFALQLKYKMPMYIDEIQAARSSVQEFYYDEYIDLYHFAKLINDTVPDYLIRQTAQAVMEKINQTVIAEAHGASYTAYGLSIYYPATQSEYDPNYENLDFANDTQWDEFLNTYYNPPPSYDLSNFPEPFTEIDGPANCTIIVGCSDPHGPCGAAHTLDTVGGIRVSAVIGKYSANITNLSAYLDTDVADYDDVNCVVYYLMWLPHIVTVGGPGVNMITWKYFANPWYAPVYFSREYNPDSGQEEWVINTPNNKYWEYNVTSTPELDDIGVIEIVYIGDEGRYVLVAAGLGGYGTRAACLLLQMFDSPDMPFPLQGIAIVFKWVDTNGDCKVQLNEITLLEQVG